MRHPRLAAAGGLVLALFCGGCEVYAGKLYWSGKAPSYQLEKSCEPADVDSRPSVRIEVTDEQMIPLRGAAVRFASRGPGARLAEVTGATGIVEAGLGAGSWEVEVTLAGYRPVRYGLDLPEGQACVLELRLWKDNSVGFFF